MANNSNKQNAKEAKAPPHINDSKKLVDALRNRCANDDAEASRLAAKATAMHQRLNKRAEGGGKK